MLLCRDIELACDEKVIKVLGNEQRADYTQALVACSVNRRVIAACPLAFGEVGVKERVKSVMNYKKPAFWVVVLAVIACVVVAVCFLTDPEQDSYTLRIVVPAGSQDDFVYSDEEVSTTGNSIVIWSGEGLDDTEVLLFPVDETTETGYTATYLTHGMPVEFDAVKDEWFKVGINMQNPTDEDIVVYVEVENVEIRISDESAPNRITFKAEVLEIHEGYFLVAPEASWALNSADQIEVPLMNMDPALEPQIGDIIEVSYSGEILETYPARLKEVYSIRVVAETTKLTLDDVIILSQYGYDLSWSDFENYDYIETGSGLYIRVYVINEMYELWIGGGSPDSDPMENMSVKKNGVTMHFGDRFCMGGKKPRKFGRGDPKIYVPTWCPKRKVPSELRIYGFKSVEQWMLHHDMCEQLGTDISPSAFRYAVAYELHTPLTPREFAKRCNEEPDAETLGVAVHRHYVVEIDDGIKPEFFYKTQNGYVLLGLFDAATARKNVKEDTD